MKRVFSGVCLLLLLSGCGRIIVDGVRTTNKAWNRSRETVERRFRAQFRCGTPHSTLVDAKNRYPVAISVEGCGVYAMYSRTMVDVRGSYNINMRSDSSWRLDSYGQQ